MLEECKRDKCFNCTQAINRQHSYVLWQTMDFCNESCWRKFLDNKCSQCVHCLNSIDKKILGDFSLRYGNHLQHFCSKLCRQEFTRDAHLCHYCYRDISKEVDLLQNFCNEKCKMNFERIENGKNNNKESMKQQCSECDCIHDSNIEFVYKDQTFFYCSFNCFRKLKFHFGIYAGECHRTDFL